MSQYIGLSVLDFVNQMLLLVARVYVSTFKSTGECDYGGNLVQKFYLFVVINILPPINNTLRQYRCI
jgi:hypothetical protein